jgi:hypothetical protein
VAGEQGFHVDAQTIGRHAATVEHVADGIEQGRGAAASVQLGRDAYGRLCQLVPSLLDPVQNSVIAALGEAAGSLQQTADNLRGVARGYDNSDQRGSDRFGGGWTNG